jgi:DNA-binding NarL/FixJ family response regulator
MRVLIVDDNPSMRRLIRSVIEGVADVIGECGDGSEAVAAYDALQPDCVLMDIRMEPMDGVTATRQIAAAWPAARICIVTEHDDADLRAAARRAGACAYVVKDDLLSLRAMLRTGLGGPTVR